jgi:hypothetical protein
MKVWCFITPGKVHFSVIYLSFKCSWHRDQWLLTAECTLSRQARWNTSLVMQGESVWCHFIIPILLRGGHLVVMLWFIEGLLVTGVTNVFCWAKSIQLHLLQNICHGKDGAESLKKILSTVPCTGTVWKLVVDKYQIRGSVLDSWIWKNLCFFLDDAWLTLSRNVNSQNKICWCNENTHVVHEICFTLATSVMSVCKIIRPVFQCSNNSVKLIQHNLLFRELTEEDKLRDNAYNLQ